MVVPGSSIWAVRSTLTHPLATAPLRPLKALDSRQFALAMKVAWGHVSSFFKAFDPDNGLLLGVDGETDRISNRELVKQ